MPSSETTRASWLTPPAYWTPEQIVESAWIEHAPFAFWLMDELRPDTVVELGTHLGYSLFVFADAVKRLGLPTRLFALDSWEGDDHAGFYGQDVYDSVSSTVYEHYSDSVVLLRNYFSDSVSEFEDGSIDLLHIDGRHRFEDVSEDFALFEPKLSSRAVVLFHDTFEFRDDFGVYRLWDDVSRRFPSFNFEHEHGLGVLAYGADVPASVLDFLERAQADPTGARAAFANAGARLTHQRRREEAIGELSEEFAASKREVDRLRGEVDRLSAELAEVRRREEKLAGVAEEYRTSTSWRLTAPLRVVKTAIRGHR